MKATPRKKAKAKYRAVGWACCWGEHIEYCCPQKKLLLWWAQMKGIVNFKAVRIYVKEK